MKRVVRALTTTVAVDIAADFVRAELAELLLVGYPNSDEVPVLSFQLANDRVVGEGRYVDRVDDPDDVVPMFELDLYQEVAWRSSPGWLLHAAALEHDGGAFVFAGPSGAGKTTLTLGLMARGWKLLTEEMVLIDADLQVHGLARPIHAPYEGAQRAGIPKSWRALAYPMRTATGKQHSVITQPPAEARQHEALPLRALVRLCHGPELASQILGLSGAAAIERFWDATLRKDADGLVRASAIVTACPGHELRSSSPAEALRQAVDFASLSAK